MSEERRPPHEEYPPLLQSLNDHEIVNLDRLEELLDEGTVNPGVFNKLRRTGVVTRNDFDKLGGEAVLKQIVSTDVLDRMQDEHLVSVKGNVKDALKGHRKGEYSTERWAVIFGDFFILAAYDW